ncbi:GRF zinc finger containing protein [Striga asiatica]|uniref:GRF zinc finger containing protein n=1 Tax=Striga asiatica TaxID=4170 RepID=A0A5A7QF56_STRAF|nr:GRF zinc finger containing protein [Striga asiatica]
MNNNEKFKQRWELRRKEVDTDTSSDDSQPNASGPHAGKRPNLVAGLVLLKNDEASDKPTLAADERKTKSSKKAKGKKYNAAVQKKSNSGPIKKNKRNKNLMVEHAAMFEDLKAFADSLMQELTAARENMVTHFKDEMRKLTAIVSKKPVRNKNARCSQKNIAKPKNCTVVRNTKGKVESDARKSTKPASESVEKNEEVLQRTKNDGLNKGDNGLTVPAVIPKPQFQNPRTHLPLGDHKFYRQYAVEQHLGSFSSISNSNRSLGLIGQNYPRAPGIPFPVPLGHLGSDNGSNFSSLTYCGIPLADKVNDVGLRLNGINVNFPKGNHILKNPNFIMWRQTSEYIVEDLCRCGKNAVRKTSWSEENCGRRYGASPRFRKSGGCTYYLWIDPSMCTGARQIIPGLLKKNEKLEDELKSKRFRERCMWLVLVLSWMNVYLLYK